MPIDRQQAATKAMIGGIAGIAGAGLLIALGILLWFTRRSITGPLDAVAAQLTESNAQILSAAGQSSAAAQSLSQGATEQAASLEETSASMEEMASMTRQNAENTQAADADGRGRRARAAIQRRLGDMVASMTAIASRAEGLEDHQDDRRDRVSDQHPRAQRRRRSGACRRSGHGLRRGRRRSAQPRAAIGASGQEHGGLIEVVGRQVAAKGRSGSPKSPTRFPASPSSVGQVKGLVEQVSASSRQQAQGIDQVSQAISQMEKVTQTTAATAEESAAAERRAERAGRRRDAGGRTPALDRRLRAGGRDGEGAQHAFTSPGASVAYRFCGRRRLAPAPRHRNLREALIRAPEGPIAFCRISANV